MRKFNQFSFLIIVLSLAFISCVHDNKQVKMTTQLNLKKIITSKKGTLNQIIGIWKVPGEDNSTFQIFKDSIYYTDEGSMFKYSTKDDSLFIYYDGWVDKSEFKVINNKLIIKDELSIDTFEVFK